MLSDKKFLAQQVDYVIKMNIFTCSRTFSVVQTTRSKHFERCRNKHDSKFLYRRPKFIRQIF